ncbi:hypothetical protein AB0G32_33025 [Streptomyces sp. NPDC023723]|uniref:hypothetical protein n=1 Tax=Streptomyces sp. NPDC023723 TaxID=3154323 RepID=UPI0033E410B3
MSDNRAALAAAVAGGYLMGRTKKAKLAFAVGSYLTGRRLGLAPGQVLSQGLGRLQQVPQLQELSDQVRGELLTAGRAAVTAAASRRLDRFADALRERTDLLDGADRQDDDDDGDGDGADEDQYDPADEAGYADADEPPRKAAKKTAKKAAAPARRQPRGGGRR